MKQIVDIILDRIICGVKIIKHPMKQRLDQRIGGVTRCMQCVYKLMKTPFMLCIKRRMKLGVGDPQKCEDVKERGAFDFGLMKLFMLYFIRRMKAPIVLCREKLMQQYLKPWIRVVLDGMVRILQIMEEPV